MNYSLVCRLLGVIAWLIGGTMIGSLPWAHPALGALEPEGTFETRGFFALLGSILVCAIVGWLLRRAGKTSSRALFRKEAMAVVGLSWVLATVLGALPFYLAQTSRGRVDGPGSAPIRMTAIDCMFEAQSGFSTTGATVLNDVEDAQLVPRCILFWRSSTHFLGGLGIIVLFVAVLGHGSAGKALMRAEIPGPSKEGSRERMQQTAWNFALIYVALNVVLTLILLWEMSLFDAICHAVGTMATGGFSTYNASVGHFDNATVDYVITFFMILAGTNFTLLWLTAIGKPQRLFADVEWRTYMAIVLGITLLLVVMSIILHGDFDPDRQLGWWDEFKVSVRYSLFQVVSIVTTSGFATHNFDNWNHFARAVLFLLMFVGGCAGSTAGGMKVIRHILFIKILGMEVEHSYHPSVVRHVRLGGQPITDPDLRRQILVYFGLITFIFMLSWIALMGLEHDATWVDRGYPLDNKMVDSASAVAATLNNIGPGLGTVGATENYSAFSGPSKLLFTFLMMLGRLELFAILVLLSPSFWRTR